MKGPLCISCETVKTFPRTTQRLCMMRFWNLPFNRSPPRIDRSGARGVFPSGQAPEAHNELAFVLRQRLRDFAGLLYKKLPDRPEGAIL